MKTEKLYWKSYAFTASTKNDIPTTRHGWIQYWRKTR